MKDDCVLGGSKASQSSVSMRNIARRILHAPGLA